MRIDEVINKVKRDYPVYSGSNFASHAQRLDLQNFLNSVYEPFNDIWI